MNKFIVLGGAALLLALAQPAAAEVTVQEYESSQGQVRADFTYWLNGVASGYGWANAGAEKPLFCQPDKLGLTGSQVEDIFQRYVDNHPDIAAKAKYAGLVLLLALQETFPCPDA